MIRPPAHSKRLTVGTIERYQTDEVETVQLHVDVPRDLYWFQGHFEDNPVLPAVVQLREVLLVAGGLWPDLVRLRRIRGAKFRRPIRPADRLLLCFRRSSGGYQLAFEFKREEDSCSSGVLEFAQTGVDE